MNIPEIRILVPGSGFRVFEPLLRPELEQKGLTKFLDKDFLDKKAAEIAKAWQLYEKKILQGMCEALDLEFKQNLIEVHILPFEGSFSWPLTIGYHYYGKDRAIDVITHELIHRLLVDNTKLPYDYDTWPKWRKIIGDEPNAPTFIHIIVHLVMKYVFLDVLHEPERLARDIADCQQYENYRLAWEYVESHDYKKLLIKIRESYNELSTNL